MGEVSISETRKKTDWTGQMKRLADGIYPDAEKIVLACDNLNTFYDAFPPSEARGTVTRLRCTILLTGMAEPELAAFSSQCLNRRTGSIDSLQKA